jgi:hypothetical protein
VRVIQSCAADFGSCSYGGDGMVVYGRPGKTVSKQVTGKGSLACSPQTFGSDPAPNVPKNCFFLPKCQILNPTDSNLGWDANNGSTLQMIVQCVDPSGAIQSPGNYTYTFDFAPNQPITYPDGHVTCYLGASFKVDTCKYGAPATTIAKVSPALPFAPGNHSITVSASGFAPATFSFVAAPPAPVTRTCTVQTGSSGDWYIQGGASNAMLLKCTDSTGAAPSTNFSLAFDFAPSNPLSATPAPKGDVGLPNGTIAADGTLTISGTTIGKVTVGAHSVTFAAPGWPTTTVPFTVKP